MCDGTYMDITNVGLRTQMMLWVDLTTISCRVKRWWWGTWVTLERFSQKDMKMALLWLLSN